MKTFRELINLVESAQTPVAEDLIDHNAPEPLAKHFAELYYNGLSPADEAKMAAHVYQQVVDGEMSIEQLKQHIAKLEKRKGVAEAQKTDNRPASQFDREIVKAQPDGSCELKCGHKTSANLSKNPIGKKIFCGRCYELRNKEPGVAEGQTTRTCPQCDGSGEDTLDPTKSCRRCGGKGHIPMSPREQEATKWGRKSSVYPFSK